MNSRATSPRCWRVTKSSCWNFAVLRRCDENHKKNKVSFKTSPVFGELLIVQRTKTRFGMENWQNACGENWQQNLWMYPILVAWAGTSFERLEDRVWQGARSWTHRCSQRLEGYEHLKRILGWHLPLFTEMEMWPHSWESWQYEEVSKSRCCNQRLDRNELKNHRAKVCSLLKSDGLKFEEALHQQDSKSASPSSLKLINTSDHEVFFFARSLSTRIRS